MHQQLIQRFERGCLMLMDQREQGLFFLGTAFMVDARGYLLTAAHLLREAVNPAVVDVATPAEFSPLSKETGMVHPVRVARVDSQRDLALLAMDAQVEAAGPPEFFGNPDIIVEGTYLLALGVSFGHFRIHNVMVMGGLLAGKLVSPNGTNLLILDSPSHPGDPGGPLINTEDGRVVGVLQGVFDPTELIDTGAAEDFRLPSRFTYAVSIEYAHPLLEAEGLKTPPPV